MKLNICSLLFFLAKLVSLEAERLPNTANIILPKSFCQLTPCSICWGDCDGDDSAAPVWSRLEAECAVWWGFGGNHFLLERWGLLSNLSMCKAFLCLGVKLSRKTWWNSREWLESVYRIAKEGSVTFMFESRMGNNWYLPMSVSCLLTIGEWNCPNCRV